MANRNDRIQADWDRNDTRVRFEGIIGGMVKFSVIVPAYNEEKYIGTLLNALIKQTFKDFEVIIVDGNSQDKTAKVAEKFARKLDLRVLRLKRRGISFQRNTGAKKAKYDHLVFFDADVKPEPRFLAKIKSVIETENFDVITTWVDHWDGEMIDSALCTLQNLLVLDLTKRFWPNAVGTFIYSKKKAFNKVGGFDEKIVIAEDCDLVKRMHRAGYKFEVLRDPKIHTSVRRITKEGRIKFLQKYAKVGFDMTMKGAPKDLEQYGWIFGRFGD